MKKAATPKNGWNDHPLRSCIESNIGEFFVKLQQKEDGGGIAVAEPDEQPALDTCVIFLGNEKRYQYNYNFLSEMLDTTAVFECQVREKKKTKIIIYNVFAVFIPSKELNNEEKTKMWVKNFIFSEPILPIYYNSTLINVINLDTTLINVET